MSKPRLLWGSAATSLVMIVGCGDGNQGDPISSQPEGSGVLTIGDETWEFNVTACSSGDDPEWNFTLWGGNDEIFVEATRDDTGGTSPLVEVMVTIGQGQAIWEAHSFVADENGIASINQTDREDTSISFRLIHPPQFTYEEGTTRDASETASGSIEASCP